MSLKEFLNKALAENLAKMFFGALGALISIALYKIGSPIYQSLCQSVGTETIVQLFVISIAINLGSFAWVIYLLSVQNKKLKKAFGVLWDKALNPHCPACESLLTWRGFNDDQAFGFECLKCKASLRLMDNMGRSMNLPSAQKAFRDQA